MNIYKTWIDRPHVINNPSCQCLFLVAFTTWDWESQRLISLFWLYVPRNPPHVSRTSLFTFGCQLGFRRPPNFQKLLRSLKESNFRHFSNPSERCLGLKYIKSNWNRRTKSKTIVQEVVVWWIACERTCVDWDQELTAPQCHAAETRIGGVGRATDGVRIS